MKASSVKYFMNIWLAQNLGVLRISFSFSETLFLVAYKLEIK